MRDENQCLHGRDAHAPLAFASYTLSSHVRMSDLIPLSVGNWILQRKRRGGRLGRVETGLLVRTLPIETKEHPQRKQAGAVFKQEQFEYPSSDRRVSKKDGEEAGEPQNQKPRICQTDPKKQKRHPLRRV